MGHFLLKVLEGALNTPLKILGQGMQEGVKVENGPYPQISNPHFS